MLVPQHSLSPRTIWQWSYKIDDDWKVRGLPSSYCSSTKRIAATKHRQLMLVRVNHPYLHSCVHNRSWSYLLHLEYFSNAATRASFSTAATFGWDVSGGISILFDIDWAWWCEYQLESLWKNRSGSSKLLGIDDIPWVAYYLWTSRLLVHLGHSGCSRIGNMARSWQWPEN